MYTYVYLTEKHFLAVNQIVTDLLTLYRVYMQLCTCICIQVYTCICCIHLYVSMYITKEHQSSGDDIERIKMGLRVIYMYTYLHVYMHTCGIYFLEPKVGSLLGAAKDPQLLVFLGGKSRMYVDDIHLKHAYTYMYISRFYFLYMHVCLNIY